MTRLATSTVFFPSPCSQKCSLRRSSPKPAQPPPSSSRRSSVATPPRKNCGLRAAPGSAPLSWHTKTYSVSAPLGRHARARSTTSCSRTSARPSCAQAPTRVRDQPRAQLLAGFRQAAVGHGKLGSTLIEAMKAGVNLILELGPKRSRPSSSSAASHSGCSHPRRIYDDADARRDFSGRCSCVDAASNLALLGLDASASRSDQDGVPQAGKTHHPDHGGDPRLRKAACCLRFLRRLLPRRWPLRDRPRRQRGLPLHPRVAHARPPARRRGGARHDGVGLRGGRARSAAQKATIVAFTKEEKATLTEYRQRSDDGR